MGVSEIGVPSSGVFIMRILLFLRYSIGVPYFRKPPKAPELIWTRSLRLRLL